MLSVDGSRSNGTGKRGDSLTIICLENKKGEIFIMMPKKEKYIYKPMCKVVEDMINEEVRENNIAITMRMLEDGKLSVEEIAEYTGLSKDEIKSLSDEQRPF